MVQSSAKVTEIVSACAHHGGRNIIVLSGVAATGKTYLGLSAAKLYTSHPYFVKQIQFHQSYSYEDFIEGLFPTKDGGFFPRPGVFLHWNDQALRDPRNKYVLLIEELTRANLSSVIGELMTFIEYRDRTFETPLTRRRIKVAANLTVIATMNPQDRSALEVDDALIRRLRIIECPPSTEQLREMLPTIASTTMSQLINIFETCKARYPDTYADLMPFGHGIFSGVADEHDLSDLWRTQIRFLLKRNAQVAAHPFAKDIAELYPWK